MLTATSDTEAPAPGLHPNVPLATYLRWPLLSQSTLKEMRNSPAHLRAALDGERVKNVTDDMALGSALHTCFLEPEHMLTRVVRWDGGTRRGKAWDEFSAEHAERIILTPGYYESLVGMVKALRRHPFVREWVGRIQHTEVSCVGDVHGVPMKGRCDALTAEPMVDLKKVRTADPRAFTNAVLAYGYHWQAYIYGRLFNRERFVLLTVEDSEPFDVVAFEFSPAFIRLAEAEVIPMLDRYKWAVEHDSWPGRAEEVVQLEVPEWAANEAESEVTVGGESAFDDDKSEPF